MPDERLERLFRTVEGKEKTEAAVEFFDIAGLVKGASKGEGLGNRFLGHIREVDALAHVVRCFREGQVAHPAGHIDPVGDMDTVDIELLLADVETVQRRLEAANRAVKARARGAAEEKSFLELLRDALDRGEPARRLQAEGRQQATLADCHLLTSKPVVVIANVGEGEPGPEERRWLEDVEEAVAGRGARVVVVCGKIEAELAELEPEERGQFISGMGMDGTGLADVIRESYRVLDLVTFYTCEEGKVRAWPVPAGTPAAGAAGKIHTDMEQGFIRAEVMKLEELESCGGVAGAREAGLIRMESRDYAVKDGDVITFHFRKPR